MTTEKMKTAKKLILTILALTAFNFSFAQKEDWGSDSAECRKNVSLYNEPMRQKNYDEALIYLRKVYAICPKYKESIYINGAIIYRDKIDKEKDPATKEKYIDTLISVIYEKQLEYFGRKTTSLERYGNDMMKYRQSTPMVAYKIFKEIIDAEKENSSCIAIMRYYQTLVLLYNKKEPGFDVAKMVEEYFKCRDYMDKTTIAHPDDKNCATASGELDNLALNFLSCELLVPNLTKSYEKLPAEKDARLPELKKMASILEKRNCTDSDLFEKISIEIVEAEPSHNAYYNIGLSKLKKKKYSEANDFFKKAIDACGECENLCDYYIGAAKANLGAGSYSTAATFARQSIGKCKDNSEAYSIIAQAIAGTDCGANDFERKCRYWLAYDYAKKAGNGSLMSNYKSRFPTKAEIFDHGLIDKTTFHIGCWMNEDATIYKD